MTSKAIQYDEYTKADKVVMAVDCIIFGFDGEDLCILTIKRYFEPQMGAWSLVGGIVKNDETLWSASERVLKKYTGLDDIFMQQVHTFSQVDRDPAERTISTAYFALINVMDHNDKMIEEYSARWYKLKECPTLVFDHNKMLNYALNLLRHKASTEPIAFELLPEKFTMKQLQKLYEAIWGIEIDKRNFVKKINSFKILERLEEKDTTTSKKGSYFYRFNAETYKKESEDSMRLRY